MNTTISQNEKKNNSNKKDVKLKRYNAIPSFQETLSRVKKYIVGQDEAVCRAVLAIYRSLKIRSIKTNMLIIGGTGTGKSETMKQISRELRLPYVIEDSTQYTKEGYVGSSVQNIIKNLYFKANRDIVRTRNGLVIIDEIDKKVNHSFQDDISGDAVIHSLLKMVEGTSIKVDNDPFGKPITVNTSNIIFVFMGAFQGIEKIREERLAKKNHIGFSADNKEVLEGDIEQETGYTKEDLIKYGMNAEFVGRMDTIIEFKDLLEGDLARIVKESKLSIFSKYEEFLKEIGIKLEYDEEVFNEIARKAIRRKAGARGLSDVTNQAFEKILIQVFSSQRVYKRCILKKGFAKNPDAFELV